MRQSVTKRLVGVIGFSMVGVFMLSGCSNQGSPTSAANDQSTGDVVSMVAPSVPEVPGTRILTRCGFETTVKDPSKNYIRYMMTVNDQEMPFMQFTRAVAHSGEKSLTTMDSGTAIEQVIPSLESGVVGIQFYIRGDAYRGSNFIVGLGKTGSSGMSSYYYFGMGFDKSDSIKYVLYHPADNKIKGLAKGETSKNVAPFRFNKWYKCAIEYGYATRTVSFYLDGNKVGSKTLPAGAIMNFDMWVAMSANIGNNFSVPLQKYFADDVTIYQRP